MPDLEGFQSSEQATGTVFRARRSFAETDKQEAGLCVSVLRCTEEEEGTSVRCQEGTGEFWSRR